MCLFHRLLAASVLVWLAGCNNSVPASPTSSPQPATYMVSGILSATVDGVSRPLAGRRVNLYISGTCGPPGNLGAGCRPEKEEVVLTDHDGRYTAQVPDSWPLSPKTLVFVAGNGPELQPCLASAAIDHDTTVDVQVIPTGSSSTPPSATSPMITGFVYETTAQGRSPSRGVRVWLEVGYADSYQLAITQTDSAGYFFLCRVNAPVRMVVSGYQDWMQSIPGTGDMFFEIELRR